MCQVFAGDAVEGLVHLHLALLVRGADGKRVDRGRQAQRLEREFGVRVGEQTAVRGDRLALRDDADVTGLQFIGLDQLAAQHPVELAGGDPLVARSDHQLGGTGDHALGDLDIGEFSIELVDGRLEAVGGGAAVRLDRQVMVHAFLVQNPLDVAFGGGCVVLDEVEQRVHAQAFVRRAAEDRHNLVGVQAVAQAAADLVVGERAFVEVLHHQVVGAFGGALDQLGAVLLDLVLDVVRHIIARAAAVVARQVRLVFDQVHDATERVAAADRHGNRHERHLEAFLHLFDDGMIIRAFLVHLVDEDEARFVSVVQSSPQLQGLDLDAVHGIDDHHRALAGAEAADCFSDETGGTRSVKQVDLLAVDGKGNEGSMNGNLLGDLFFREIADCLAALHSLRMVDHLRLEEQLFNQCGLACTIVSDNGDVPYVRTIDTHKTLLL